MIEKLNQKLIQFYQFSFIFLMIVTLGTIVYFWKLGFVDGSRSKELHKANYILEQLETKKPLAEVKSVVFEENSKMAIQKMEALEIDLAKIHALSADTEFKQLRDEIQVTKSSIANLISFPKVSKIISVFNDKLLKFNQFVKYNKWMSLTRSSQRMLEISKGHINKEKLDKFSANLERDILHMLKITESSFLKRSEKSEIVSRLNNLEIEIKMINKYMKARDAFGSQLNNLERSLNNWIQRISPEISYQKIQVEQIGRYYIMGLLGILSLSSILFFAGFIFNRWHKNKAQSELEKFVELFVSDRLIAGNEMELGNFSKHFQNFSDHMTGYIDKRMSYGAIFQEALPLSSIMLDKNLKVIWANKQFCDDWNIAEEEINKDYLSWDFLSKLTNIGDDDPVLEALKHKVAGIYQIQIKPSEDLETKPYEMFVSPVRFKNETRIMLFFYSLMNMQDTITSQARSIVNPIEKILDFIQKGNITEEERENLVREFEIANISSLLNKFDSLISKQEQAKAQLLNQVEVLYHKLDEAFDVTDLIESANSKISENNTSQVQNLKSFKENVISLSSIAKDFEQKTKDEFSTLENTIKSFAANTTKVKELKNIVYELTDTIPKFGEIRIDIKEHKTHMNEAKMRFSHSLAQMVHLKKQIGDGEILSRFTNSYDRVNSEFRKLDTVSVDLDKKLTHLEVMLSKTQMLMNDIATKMPGYETKQEVQTLESATKEVSNYAAAINELNGQIDRVEDNIIVNLKSLYLNTKSNIENSRNVAIALEKKPSLIESSDINVELLKDENSNDEEQVAHEEASSEQTSSE